jgi:hypothetical protein
LGYWEPDPDAAFKRRLGRSAHVLGLSSSSSSCPDIWELRNGDFAIVGTDMTEAYAGRLPGDVSLVARERLVVVPRAMMVAAKPDIPDA